MDHADVRYLEAKRTVDERALSPRVFDHMVAELSDAPAILEAGAGTGTSVPRLVTAGVTTGSYRGVDRSEAVVSYARDQRSTDLGAERTDTGFRLADLAVEFEVGDALEAFSKERADLLVAQSFLDLVPIAEAITAFEHALKPGGLLYAPLTFDGMTIFQPDHPADEPVIDAYHTHLASQPGRDLQAGRHLLDTLARKDGSLLDVAASDWIVRPIDGTYPADERQFLEQILAFVAEGTTEQPAATAWLDTRRTQLEAGELWYVAHQYDVLYRTARN